VIHLVIDLSPLVIHLVLDLSPLVIHLVIDMSPLVIHLVIDMSFGDPFLTEIYLYLYLSFLSV